MPLFGESEPFGERVSNVGGVADILRELKKQHSYLDSIVERQNTLAEQQNQLQTIVQEQHKELQTKLYNMNSSMRRGSVTSRGSVASNDIKTATTDTSKVDEKSSSAVPVAARKRRNHHFKEKLRKTVSLPTLFPNSWVMVQLKRAMRNPWFDTCMGFVIVLNFVALFAELQWQSHSFAFDLGLRNDDGGWGEAKQMFKILERVFNVIYLLELLLQLAVFRSEVLQRGWLNCADMVAILLASIDNFILEVFFPHKSTRAVGMLRLIKIVRAFRLMRFIRVLRLMSSFHSLRVIYKAVSNCAGSLFWSMAVLGFFILSFGLLISQLTQAFVQDELASLEERRWVFNNYGSAVRAAYTMFEATFTGAWATMYSRPLIDNVSNWFRLFFISFTVTINFALTRIVGALFLKRTMDIAAIDTERMNTAKTEERTRTLGLLSQIFDAGAGSESSMTLNKKDFQEIMDREDVQDLLEEVEIEGPELFMLYDLLCEEGSELNKEEFFDAALKLKTCVTPVDIVQLRHEQLVLRRFLQMRDKHGAHQRHHMFGGPARQSPGLIEATCV